MKDVVTQAKTQWDYAQATSASTMSVSAADQEQLELLVKGHNKDKAEKARIAAAASMESKRLKREISLS